MNPFHAALRAGDLPRVRRLLEDTDTDCPGGPGVVGLATQAALTTWDPTLAQEWEHMTLMCMTKGFSPAHGSPHAGTMLLRAVLAGLHAARIVMANANITVQLPLPSASPPEASGLIVRADRLVQQFLNHGLPARSPCGLRDHSGSWVQVLADRVPGMIGAVAVARKEAWEAAWPSARVRHRTKRM